MAFSKVRTNMYIELAMEWRSKMLWDVSATNSEIANTLISKFTYNTLIIIFYYIHTEKYSSKSYVVNFRTQISSSQSEERTMVFTREKK